MAAMPNRIEPAPRRVRGYLSGQPVFDTTAARYCWEVRHHPQYYIPLDDIDHSLLVDEERQQKRPQGLAYRFGLRSGSETRPGAVRVYRHDALPGLEATARFAWPALDAWYEEDEQVFVHPRNPYVRVDALRSSRSVRVELNGVVLAEASSTVTVFETGLPTRYYFDRPSVNTEVLEYSDTETACPYKGTTSGYWSAVTPHGVTKDVAWVYDFPTHQLLPIAGLVAFYNEKVDMILDGVRLDRPKTHLV
jgi:uncharacterized protein (DUF427 family)